MLENIYSSAKKIFPGIDNFCKKCNTCCYTYGWLLDKEADKFINKGYAVAEINKSLHCIDSFLRDEKENIIFEKIPRCRFYKNKRCSIYAEKPLDCNLYPIKVKMIKNRIFIGISLGCRYIASLSKEDKEKIYSNIVKFFKNFPPKTLNDYLNMVYNISLISKEKRFWMKKLLEVKGSKNKWEILNIYKK